MEREVAYGDAETYCSEIAAHLGAGVSACRTSKGFSPRSARVAVVVKKKNGNPGKTGSVGDTHLVVIHLGSLRP
jgi:hypothetical protein